MTKKAVYKKKLVKKVAKPVEEKPKVPAYVKYDSNNSGGRWPLDDHDWEKLEKAGWEVQWGGYEFRETFIRQNGRPPKKEDIKKKDRWLDSLATHATLKTTSLKEAIYSFEKVTGQNTSTLGCNCCGPPHSFTLYTEDGRSINYYSPSSGGYGEPYEGD